jgi:hypothetical protein
MSAFKGVWIDASLLTDPRLSHTERIVYAYMIGLPRFHASDAHMAKVLGMSPKTVAHAIVALRKHGLVAGRGNTRQPVRTSRNQEVGLPENGNIDIRGDIREIREDYPKSGSEFTDPLEADSDGLEDKVFPLSRNREAEETLQKISAFRWSNSAR